MFTLPNDFNGLISSQVFPADLKELKFGKGFNQRILPGVLPDSLIKIELSDSFDKPIEPGVLPSGLKTLRFGYKYNQLIGQDVLPAKLQTLTFGYSFNQLIGQGVLPAELQTLTFGWNFNQSIEQGVLPKGLQTLTFGDEYNQPIDQDVLPKGLQTLNFGNAFDKPIGKNDLPSGLKTLTLGFRFNQSIGKNDLPSGLKTLTFGVEYNQPIGQGVLPAELQTLTFRSFDQPIDQGVLPAKLKTLTFESSFNQPIGRKVLPDGLQTLNFGQNFNQPIGQGVLPDGLQSLTFGNKFDKPIGKNVLPSGLETLTFLGHYNQSIGQGVLPDGLKKLKFESYYFEPIGQGVLPDGLEELYLEEEYNQPLPAIPTKLEKLVIYKVEQLAWAKIISVLETLDEDNIKKQLQTLYRSGIPVPVEPHENTLLYTYPSLLPKIRYFSIDRTLHEDYITHSKKLRKLVDEWVEGDYSLFNRTVSKLNEYMVKYDEELAEEKMIENDEVDLEGDLWNFTIRLGIPSFLKAYQLLREAILNAPKMNHPIFAWRGVKIGDEICQSLVPGQVVGFSRFMACSVAQEVSCNFAEGGELLLVELPANCPLLNLTSLKGSEPEFLLPDRSCFVMVDRIPNKWCRLADCKFILYLRFIGIYSPDLQGMELSFEPVPGDLKDMKIFGDSTLSSSHSESDEDEYSDNED